MRSLGVNIFLLFSVMLTALHATSFAQYDEGNATTTSRRATEPRAVPDSVADQLRNSEEFSYANDPAFWVPQLNRQPTGFEKFLQALMTSPFLKWTLYLLLGLFITYIVYQVIASNNFFIFSKSPVKAKLAAGNEASALAPPELDQLISQAVINKDYRQAVRYHYLKTLNVLNNANKIRLHARATNQEYVQQMQQYPSANQFRMLTGIYEYVWYGEFYPNEQQFELINRNFNAFIVKH